MTSTSHRILIDQGNEISWIFPWWLLDSHEHGYFLASMFSFIPFSKCLGSRITACVLTLAIGLLPSNGLREVGAAGYHYERINRLIYQTIKKLFSWDVHVLTFYGWTGYFLSTAWGPPLPGRVRAPRRIRPRTLKTLRILSNDNFRQSTVRCEVFNSQIMAANLVWYKRARTYLHTIVCRFDGRLEALIDPAYRVLSG